MDANTMRRLGMTGRMAPAAADLAPPVAMPGAQLITSLNPFLGLIPPELMKNRKDPLFPQLNPGAIVAGGIGSAVYNVPNNIALLVFGGTVDLVAADGVTPVAFFAADVQIIDGNNNNVVNQQTAGQATANQGAPVLSLFGSSANQPAFWPVPKWWDPSTNVQLSIISRDAVTKTARFTLWAIQVYLNTASA